jgi:hypothetical protein
MANLDKDKLLAALRASLQNPRAGELVVLQLEQGEFDVRPAKATPAAVVASEPVE